jgi:hypothetical protein
MNADQRKKILAAQLEISKQCAVLEDIKNENQDSFDNLSEGLQQTDKGQEMEQAISDLDEAISALQEADNYLSNF